MLPGQAALVYVAQKKPLVKNGQHKYQREARVGRFGFMDNSSVGWRGPKKKRKFNEASSAMSAAEAEKTQRQGRCSFNCSCTFISKLILFM